MSEATKLKYYEPRKQFRYIFKHELIPSFLIKSVVIPNSSDVFVSFMDTESDQIFEKLLQSLLSKNDTANASYKTLDPVGATYANIDLGRLKIISVQPAKLDYASDEPIQFDAVFKRLDV